MVPIIIPTLLLFIFSIFNLLGLKENLVALHITYFLLGVFAYGVVKKIGLHFFKLNAHFFYWSFVLLLIFTYFFGLEIKGSRRWIELYLFNFQTSEFFKVFFILFLANFFSSQKKHISEGPMFLLSIFYFFVPFILILKQPDLGTAMVYAFVFGILLFFSGVPRKYIYSSLLVGLIFLPLVWHFMHDYQKNRIFSFINPHIDQQGTTYNMMQAIITIGSGKFLGKGLGLGTQSGLFFLPENHTDFAFSSLVEQFGFLGGIVVIILYMIMVFILMRKIVAFYYQRDDVGRFSFLLTLGILCMFIFQVFVNIGMNLGVLPIAGITLPFISWGGSSLITFWIALALLP